MALTCLLSDGLGCSTCLIPGHIFTEPLEERKREDPGLQDASPVAKCCICQNRKGCSRFGSELTGEHRDVKGTASVAPVHQTTSHGAWRLLYLLLGPLPL